MNAGLHEGLMPACAKSEPEFKNIRYFDAGSVAIATATGPNFHCTESKLQERATEKVMKTCRPKIVELMTCWTALKPTPALCISWCRCSATGRSPSPTSWSVQGKAPHRLRQAGGIMAIIAGGLAGLAADGAQGDWNGPEWQRSTRFKASQAGCLQ